MNKFIRNGTAGNGEGQATHDGAVAMISHDIRTALSGVTGGLAQIDPAEANPNQRAILAQVKSSGVHLAKLLDRLLSQEALPGDFGEGSTVPVSVADLLGEVDALWRNRAAGRGLDFDVRVLAGCPASLLVDHTAFHRLVGNLLSNAIKFTGNGGITVVAGSGDADGFELTVQDTGPGFSESALEGAFEMYGRPASSSVPGSGLGLCIAKSIAEGLGGGIEAANRAEGGAEVTVRLPTGTGTLDPAKADDAGYGKSGELPDLSHLRILLAEDNATNQVVITQMLRAMNARPVLASDGVEALAAFENQEFDLALLDIEMPRVSGLDVIRRIRSRKDAKGDVRLVALTAYAMKEHRERIFAAGADGLIPKPLTSIGDLGEQILAFAGHPRKPELPADAPGQTETGDAPSVRGVIDREIYTALADAVGSDSMEELLEKVAEDMRAVRSGIRDGVKSRDPGLVRANTHILISVAGVIGATKLQSSAESLNSLAKRSSHPDLKNVSEQCISGISDVLELIRENRI